MSFIDIISEEDATGELADIYRSDRAALGYVPNYTKAYSHRPAVMAAWRQLNGAIRSTMDRRRYELATMAAALHLKSSYCALAHGEKLAELGSDDETVAVARDRRTAGLSEVDAAVMEFADLVADRADQVTQTDIDRLRDLGLTDPEIFDVAAAAAARCFFSKLLDATGARPDSVYAHLRPDLAEALTVGRPIAEA